MRVANERDQTDQNPLSLRDLKLTLSTKMKQRDANNASKSTYTPEDCAETNFRVDTINPKINPEKSLISSTFNTSNKPYQPK